MSASAVVAAVLALAAIALYVRLLLRRRPAARELELERRQRTAEDRLQALAERDERRRRLGMPVYEDGYELEQRP